MRVERDRDRREAVERCEILNLNRNQLLLFLIEFLVVSAIFLAGWYYIGRWYQNLVFYFARLVLLAMGYTKLEIAALNLSDAYLVNFNLVPLIALAVVTPKLTLKKRIEILVIGIPVLFLLHVLDIVVRFPMHINHSEFARMVYASIGVAWMAVPFIIWVVIAVSLRTQ